MTSDRIPIPISPALAERLAEADERLGPDAVDVILDRVLGQAPPETVTPVDFNPPRR